MSGSPKSLLDRCDGLRVFHPHKTISNYHWIMITCLSVLKRLILGEGIVKAPDIVV